MSRLFRLYRRSNGAFAAAAEAADGRMVRGGPDRIMKTSGPCLTEQPSSRTTQNPAGRPILSPPFKWKCNVGVSLVRHRILQSHLTGLVRKLSSGRLELKSASIFSSLLRSKLVQFVPAGQKYHCPIVVTT